VVIIYNNSFDPKWLETHVIIYNKTKSIMQKFVIIGGVGGAVGAMQFFFKIDLCHRHEIFMSLPH